MTSLFLSHRSLFQKHIENVMQAHSLQSIIDFLHSLLSFCVVDANSVIVNGKLIFRGEQEMHHRDEPLLQYVRFAVELSGAKFKRFYKRINEHSLRFSQSKSKLQTRLKTCMNSSN